MYSAIAVASASSTHCTRAWSIMEPGGGAPGRMLRSGTMANRFAAYQVANGGTNFLRPNAIGMATNSAKVGRLIKDHDDAQVEDQRALGPMQGEDHIADVVASGFAGVGTALDFGVPAVHRSGHLDNSGYPFALSAGPDEHIGRLWLGAV